MNAKDLSPLIAAASFVESMAKGGGGKRDRSKLGRGLLDDGDGSPAKRPKRERGQRQGSAGGGHGWTVGAAITLVHHATLVAAEVDAPIPQSIQKYDLEAYGAKVVGNATKRVEVDEAPGEARGR